MDELNGGWFGLGVFGNWLAASAAVLVIGFLAFGLWVLYCLLSSSGRIRYCQGCGDPIPERGVAGRCWRCKHRYDASDLFMDGAPRWEPDSPEEGEGSSDARFRKEANDVTDSGRF